MDIQVLVFSHLFPAEPASAVGRFVEDQAKALMDSGATLRVVTVRFAPLRLSDPVPFFRAVVRGLILDRPTSGVSARGVSYLELQCPGPRLGGGVQALIYAACALRSRHTVLDGRDYALIHAHTGLLDGVVAMIFSRRLGRPFLLTEHTGPFTSLFRGVGAKWLVGLVLRSASEIVAVSAALQNEMRQHFPIHVSKLSVIPNTFSPADFKFEPRTTATKVCGWLGYITDVKRVDRLLEVFSFVKAKCPDAKLRLITVSTEPNVFAARARFLGLSEAIEFRPAVSRGDVAQALRELSVLFVTSDTESFSVASLEALAVGTPVVSTDCGGPRDIIKLPEDGAIVTSNEPGDLATAGLRFLQDESRSTVELRDRKRRAQRAFEFFGPRSVADRYFALYRKVIGSRADKRIAINGPFRP